MTNFIYDSKPLTFNFINYYYRLTNNDTEIPCLNHFY